MKLETFTFIPEQGWSVAAFPLLDSANTLVMVFGASSFLDDPEPVHELVRAYPRAQVMGCSTAGEIFGTQIQDGSLSVAVVQFEHTRVAAASTQVEAAQDSYQAGEYIARSLNAPDLVAVFVLSNGTRINGSELVRALNDQLQGKVVVTGGLAGDGDRFERTWVINDGALTQDSVAAVGLYGGRVRVHHGSKGGWDVFGPQRMVTRSEGNVLYELDGRPALDLYKEYLGELVSGLPSSALLFPLALSEDRESQKTIVRTILGVDEEKHSLTFAGDIPEGYYAQLMKANFDRLIDGASEAALMAAGEEASAGPVLSVAISCVGRRLVLSARTEEELEATLEVLPAGVQQIGFYSYGEISPYASGTCDLHNQTMTLTTLQEL
ncbi:MAG TPA: FIST N-terminal domain-containing protein [Anaerolineales bacterium]|nr:FIST N-terminal domain-containing protein [Anaerolineales bacterium]HRQ91709.1 FIST N-terminal domain-containing protein [Anaerolineales bacterium]